MTTHHRLPQDNNVTVESTQLSNKPTTIIARSLESFLDLCDNDLLKQRNVHCVFKISRIEEEWLKEYFLNKGGKKFTKTDVFG